MSIGKKIKGKREELGLTRLALAAKVHVPENTVHLWEEGKADPTLQHLAPLADALGVSVDALVRD